jgi:hypothetical protein
LAVDGLADQVGMAVVTAYSSIMWLSTQHRERSPAQRSARRAAAASAPYRGRNWIWVPSLNRPTSMAWDDVLGKPLPRAFWLSDARGWLERHGLHSASTIRRALDARFDLAL